MNTQIYRERLYPSISTLLALSLSGPMMLLAALPFGSVASSVMTFLVPGVLIYGAFYLSPVVILDKRLSVKRLRLPFEILGSTKVFENAEEVRLQLGPGLDANAKLAIRGDIKKLLKIEIVDPTDPTPYVLISTRNPEALASALRTHLPSP